MATLYVTAFTGTGFAAGGAHVMAPKYPAAVKQAIPITAEATFLPEAFGPGTRMVMLHCDAACCVDIGPDANAELGLDRYAAGERWFVMVDGGYTVSVIAST